METRLIFTQSPVAEIWNSIYKSASTKLFTPSIKEKLSSEAVTSCQVPDLSVDLSLNTAWHCFLCQADDCPHLTTREFACGWCRRQFTNRAPVHLPVKLSRRAMDKPPLVTVYGNFCSHQCALALAIRSQESDKLKQILSSAEINLRNLYQCYDLKPAPHWELLDHNGGPLTSEAFDETTTQPLRVVYRTTAVTTLMLKLDTK